MHTIQDQFNQTKAAETDILIALGLWEKQKQRKVELLQDLRDLLIFEEQEEEEVDD